MMALFDLGFPVKGVLPVVRAVLLQLKLALHIPSVLLGSVVPALAFGTLKRDQLYRLALRLGHPATPSILD